MTRQVYSDTRQIITAIVGSVAQQAFAGSQAPSQQMASLMGTTSRGIFLKTEAKWVIFLSFEQFRGPLTVNLKGDVTSLSGLTLGGRVQLSPERITVSEAKIEISLVASSVWSAPALPKQTQPSEERLRRINSLARSAHISKGDSGLSGLIPIMLKETSSQPQAKQLAALQSQFQNGDMPVFSQGLSKLLGLGGGLTPSWDDFTLGLLLTLNRWKHIICPSFDLAELNTTLTQVAYERTTTISANLIECATLGQADERLIAALDYMMTGIGDEAEMLKGLLGWGNSSGVDALLGMLLVFSST